MNTRLLTLALLGLLTASAASALAQDFVVGQTLDLNADRFTGRAKSYRFSYDRKSNRYRLQYGMLLQGRKGKVVFSSFHMSLRDMEDMVRLLHEQFKPGGGIERVNVRVLTHEAKGDRTITEVEFRSLVKKL